MPHVIVIAGANGAGKSTVAPFLLRDKLGISDNSDLRLIAKGNSLKIEAVFEENIWQSLKKNYGKEK